MKIICLQENLHKVLSIVGRIISQRPQLPILGTVLLSAKKNVFSVWATDLNTGIKIDVPAKVEKDGEIAVPAKALLELVALIPPDKIELTQENTNLSVKTRGQNTVFAGMPALEFPKFDNKTNEEKLLELGGDALKKDIKRVLFAAAFDETRPALSGVLFKKEGKDFFIIATDGYRLSLKRVAIVAAQTKDVAIIIPADVLRALSALIDKEEEGGVEALIAQGENQIRFRVGNNVLVGRLIENEFPSYEKIIPQTTSTTAIVDREEFLNSIKIASILARESANIIRLTLKKDAILLFANAPQVGQNESLVQAQTSGDENEIAFNSRFLLDFLGNIEEKEIIFEMTGPLNPGVFKIKNDDTFLHIIMPVRIQD